MPRRPLRPSIRTRSPSERSAPPRQETRCDRREAVPGYSVAVRAVVQRVSSASVDVDEKVVGTIGRGVCVLLGVASGDEEDDARLLASRVARLRIFENEEGKLDRNVLDVAGEALVVSQFTLVAESRRHKGTRPDFSRAAGRQEAERLYERFSEELSRLGVRVATGAFGARMRLELVNEGPVTIVLDAGEFP